VTKLHPIGATGTTTDHVVVVQFERSGQLHSVMGPLL